MKILIIGAGLGGLTMAHALKTYLPQAEFKIIEKSTSLRATGASIALPGNAVDAFKYLSMQEQILKTAHPISKIRYLKYNGKLLSETKLAEHPILKDYQFIALQREELIHLLAQDILPHIQFNTVIKQYTQQDKLTHIELSDDSHFTADLIIDASGVNSTHRQAICGQDLREDLGISCWRFLTSRKTADPSYYLLSPNGGLGLLYPTSGNQSYVYLQRVQEKDNYSTDVDKASLVRFFAKFAPELQEAIDSTPTEKIIASRLVSVSEPIMTDHKSTVFIGDAAAACSPQLQQGYASAIEDALTLAWSLQAKPQLEDALLCYEQLRLSRVQWIKNASDTPSKSSQALIIYFQEELLPRKSERTAPSMCKAGRLYWKKIT
ncbi:FAD-dependent monooxygenase [Piscirickettsia litoralis]|uniref:FAD-binding domain-containing protein n=1 Tax=Piscirickettsia litoralis TaxID=1891921 RepID=A0ABX2ZZV0_9GAMM|nr:FAD-dependent monooxygenase [Piscirickettsia litoralis]ODN42132.1 hypothetical protein BGC07_03190 [Piscirickettsia litoralis]